MLEALLEPNSFAGKRVIFRVLSPESRGGALGAVGNTTRACRRTEAVRAIPVGCNSHLWRLPRPRQQLKISRIPCELTQGAHTALYGCFAKILILDLTCGTRNRDAERGLVMVERARLGPRSHRNSAVCGYFSFSGGAPSLFLPVECSHHFRSRSVLLASDAAILPRCPIRQPAVDLPGPATPARPARFVAQVSSRTDTTGIKRERLS